MSEALRCQLAMSFADLQAVAAPWDRLARAHPRPQVFYFWAWHLATWQAYGDRRRLCTPLVYRGENLVGIVPLAVEAGVLGFLARPHADYCDLLCDGVEPERMLRVALEALGDVGEGCALFQHLPPDSLMLAALQKLPAAWYRRFRLEPGDACPTLLIDGPETLKAILAKKSLRRHERSLARVGEVHWERLHDAAAIEACLEDYFAQHITRRACAGGRSLFAEERGRSFYRALLGTLDAREELHFSVLRVGDRAAAYHLGFLLDRRFTWYKPTIDVDLWRAGPGEVLIKHLMQMARDHDLVEFDFTRGDEAFKRRFTNHDRPNQHLRLLPRGLAGLRQRLELGIGDAIRGRPSLHAFSKRWRDRLGDLLRACRHHGISRLGAKILLRLERRLLYAGDRVLIYRGGGAAFVGEAPKFELAVGRLSELATLAVEHGEFFDARRMHSARRRLADGDKLMLAWRGREIVHVAWLGRRSEIVAASEVGTEISFALPRPGTVIYDCFTPDSMRGQGIYGAVLTRIRPLDETRDLWIYCHAANHASRRGIAKAGFQPSQCMGRRVLFGRFRSWWSQPYTEKP